MNNIKNLNGPPLANTLPENAPANRPENKIDKRDPKMMEAAQAFENQFLRQMVSQMRKTVPRDDLVPDSMAENMFRENLDNEYTDQWVKQGGVGIADVIYEQLNQRYGNIQQPPPKSKDEFLKMNGQKNANLNPLQTDWNKAAGNQAAGHQAVGPHASGLQDLLSKKDGVFFVGKRDEHGLNLKSREPLTEKISLHSPLSGLVLQAASLEDGRQMVVVKHDEGLVSQLVHTGRNQVQTGFRVEAGAVLADLAPTNDGMPAKVFFGLRKASKTE